MHGRQGERLFAAALAIGTFGAIAIVAAGLDAGIAIAFMAAVQIGSRAIGPSGVGTGEVALGLRVRRAMARGEIVMHYQPKVSLTTGELVGVEALARWRHPRRGLLAPGEWMAGAELAWTERRFARYTLEAAIEQAHRWLHEEGLDILVCVNVTPRCFADGYLPEFVTDALERAGLGPERLQIELTEAALDLSPAAIDVARRLNELGIGLALDDFGVGHSSMERLARLPINELKIDRRFVMHHARLPREAAIVRGAIDLSHALGVAVTAEGVETRHDLDALRRDGCDTAQGYLYAPALDPDDLVRWHRDRGAHGELSMPERRRLPDRRLWQRRSEEQAAPA